VLSGPGVSRGAAASGTDRSGNQCQPARVPSEGFMRRLCVSIGAAGALLSGAGLCELARVGRTAEPHGETRIEPPEEPVSKHETVQNLAMAQEQPRNSRPDG
jgi:hypothetical protein